MVEKAEASGNYFKSSGMSWWRPEKLKNTYGSRIAEELRRQLQVMQELLPEAASSNLKIAILGFGFGREAEAILEKIGEARIIGLDINPSRFRESSNNLGSDFSQVRPVVGDINSLPIQDNSVDVVVALEVLMHLPHPERVIQEMMRIVKPGGDGYEPQKLDHPLFFKKLLCQTVIR